ncbi:hypothetical protein HYX09_01990 [Candidatus Woesearchaeota archaeon]|nr:hypothetical protein [Candidatus Woesearchaeota archaeon]
MEILIAASLISAFIAGIAALFAPCCITILLPAYLGSIFRQKHKVILMTFIFFLGLLTVFLPLGLGMAWLGQTLSQYHDTIFIIGGIFLALLGTLILLGIHFSLPFSVYPTTKIVGASSVFVLGIFSAFATLCCAPVLAGALALSVLPGSVLWGGIYSVTYVLGMVAPLFVIAYFIDKTNMVQKLNFFKKPISYSIFSKKVELRFVDVLAGATFLLMGALILYLAKAGRLAMQGSAYQTAVNIYMANITNSINTSILKIPAILWAFAIVALAALAAWILIKKTKKSDAEK